MQTNTETTAPPLFTVCRVFRVSGRREIIRRNLTEAEAQQVVRSYPDASRSMVIYTRQAGYSRATTKTAR